MAKQVIITPIENLSQLETSDAIRQAEVKAWACYRQKLATKYESVAKTTTKNGVETLNNINLYGTLSEGSETSELLDMLGIDEENRKKMVEAQKDVDFMYITWTLTEDPTEATINRWQKEMNEDLSTLGAITIFSTIYEQGLMPASEDIKYPWNMGVSTKSTCITHTLTSNLDILGNPIPRKSPWSGSDGGIFVFDKTRYTEGMKISKTFKATASGRENRWDETLKMLLLTNPKALTIVKKSYTVSNFRGNYRITTKVTISPQVDLGGEINKYSVDDTSSENEKKRRVTQTYDLGSEEEAIFVEGYMAKYFGIMWHERRKFLLANIEEESKGLFVDVGTEENPIVKLAYKQLRNCDSRTFQYYISTSIDIKYGTNDGFLVSFIKGLAMAVVAVIDAIINIFLEIPLLGDLLGFQIQMLGKMFGLSEEESLAISRNIARMLIVMLVIYFAPMAAGELAGAWGGTINAVMTGSLNAMNVMPILYQLYGAVDQGLAQVELENEKDERERLEGEKEEEIEIININNTMGSVEEYDQLNTMMYSSMFELHENLGLGILPQLPTIENAKGESIDATNIK